MDSQQAGRQFFSKNMRFVVFRTFYCANIKWRKKIVSIYNHRNIIDIFLICRIIMLKEEMVTAVIWCKFSILILSLRNKFLNSVTWVKLSFFLHIKRNVHWWKTTIQFSNKEVITLTFEIKIWFSYPTDWNISQLEIPQGALHWFNVLELCIE